MAYLVLLSEPFHSEHKALDRKTLTGAVEFNVPAIEIYVPPSGVFIAGPLLSCLLIVLFPPNWNRWNTGSNRVARDSSTVYEAWAGLKLGFIPDPRRSDRTAITVWRNPLLLPPCPTDPRRSDRTAITVWRNPFILPPCPTDPSRSDRTAITVWRTPLYIAALPNRSKPERQNCDNSLANPPYYCHPAQQIHAGATEL
uniref:Uncharacterized protein n=1 Tax=Glossina palpalis gambiensis TaxID=67801 RepID=A0A1B0BYN6_9MUSC